LRGGRGGTQLEGISGVHTGAKAYEGDTGRDDEPARSGGGIVAHCFVDPQELQRLLALMVAAEMAGAVVHAALSA
jgi:hypothetical protein